MRFSLYSRIVLAFFAAVIPSSVALVVAIWWMREQSRLRYERRVREKVQVLTNDLTRDVEATRRLRGITSNDPEYWECNQMILRVEHEWLSWYGVPITRPTFGRFDIDISMSGPTVRTSEIVRQWLLICSALAGIVLLALDEFG